MLKVGVTGGLASGKTFVAEALAALGCLVIHADQLGHEVLAPEGEAYQAVVAEYGREILDREGSINRKALAAVVFDDPERLAALNAIVHPHVWARIERALAAFEARDPHGIAVVEAAIMVETGSYRRFDRIIAVECDEEVQVRRAVKRDGADEAAVRARLRRQMPAEEKRKYADYVIDTSGEKSETLEQTRRVWEALRRIAT